MGRGMAIALRAGTLLAVAGVGIGLAWALIRGGEAAPAPLIDVLARGGPEALIGAGMLVLTLTPLAALAVATAWMWRAGERATMATVTLVMLSASLVAAALLTGAS